MDSTTAPAASWRAHFAERNCPNLTSFSLFTVHVLSTTAVILGVATLFRLRKCRKDIAASPSDRTAIFAACEKQMIKASKCQFMVSLLFTVLAFSIWVADAVLGGIGLYDEVSNRDSDFPTGFWLDFAIHMVGIVSMLVFTMFAVPLTQMVAFSLWMQSRASSGTFVAAILPEARTIATHLMQLWSLGFFLVVAFWSPISKNYVVRSILLQGIAGSVNAWSHMAFILTWRPEKLESLVRAEEKVSGSRLTVRYIKEAKALYTEKGESEALLPKHVEHS